ncbi:MAG TPA: LytR C-terminal domain-containing protein [Nevskiaceae bacterium]|nr:LytR C-terminal domain-containing protein [Nevskiaceae bacterium]
MKKGFLLIFLIILIGLVYKAYGFWHQRLWDGQNRLNLVAESHPIFVSSLAPRKEMTILLIPDDIFVEAIRGFGFYRAKSIYKLGQLEGQGGELLLGSIQEFLGVPLDGHVVMESLKLKADQDGEMVKKLLLSQIWLLLKSKGKTNLSAWDLAVFWWQLKKIRPSKITLVNLGQLGACSETTLADGTRVINVDSERLNQLVNQLFEDEKIRAEDLALSVLNGTGQFGLAKKAARLISNLGGRVVEAGDWQSTVLNCQLRGAKSQVKSYTAQKIKKIFGCQWTGDDLAGHRADLVIILGEDYWQKLNKK